MKIVLFLASLSCLLFSSQGSAIQEKRQPYGSERSQEDGRHRDIILGMDMGDYDYYNPGALFYQKRDNRFDDYNLMQK